jgi:hypothetical protein
MSTESEQKTEEQPLAPMREVIESVVMPGGWHKPEKDRLGRDMPQPIRADTYQKLIEAVIQFRVDNVIPIGDVRRDVNDYICSNFPHMCHPVTGAVVQVSIDHHPTGTKTLTDNMIQWLDGAITNHSSEHLEMSLEAQRRAEICIKCRFNTQWNSSCGSCLEAVNRMSSIIRMGNDTPRGHKLKACQILQHENRSAVWLRRERINQSLDLPAHCWAKS